MWCTASIRRFIIKLPNGELFTTRDCLTFGSRAAVDKALSRLVKRYFIVRLARGVFVKFSLDNPVFTAFQIAKKKAESFGRTFARHGADVAHELGLVPDNPNRPTYLITGGTSSFKFKETIISLKGTCPRKVHPQESFASKAVSALWYLGKTNCTCSAVGVAVHNFTRTDRQELRQSIALMPAWMSFYFTPG